MKKYLAEIFGLSVKIENWDGKRKLPLYLRNKREYFVLSMGNVQSVLMKNNSDNFNVSGYEKEMQFMMKNAQKNEKDGLNVEEVTKTILKIDSMKNPKLSYTIGKDALFAHYFSKLPQKIINSLVKFGLKARMK